MAMFEELLTEVRRKTSQQIEDLKSGRFQMFEIKAGEREERNCNAEMIQGLELQLENLDAAIEISKLP